MGSITINNALLLLVQYVETVLMISKLRYLTLGRDGWELGKLQNLSNILVYNLILSNVKTNGGICVLWPTSP